MKDSTVALGLLISVAAIVGWVLNIVAIATGDFDPLTGLMVLRIIGVFIAPIGAVLGYV